LLVWYVGVHCQERGVDVARLNSNEISKRLSLVYSPLAGHSVSTLQSGDMATLLCRQDEKISVWYRKPIMSKWDLATCPPNVAFAARESEVWLRDLCVCLDVTRWINHPETNRLADNKLAQLRLAKQFGFHIPETLVTNDPSEATSFMKSVAPRRVIYKTLSHPFISETADSFRSVYTSLVEMSPQVADSIRLAPCLFQECIEKAYELRVTVVGGKVFAARIFSQDHASRAIDWRRDQHKTELRQELGTLDSRLEGLCVSLVKQFGLIFGAIDLIVTPEGEFVFLEINPNGQWLWIETVLGAKISEALVEELTTPK